MLDSLGEGQLRVDSGGGICNVTLEGIHRGVDVVGKGVKFSVTANVHNGIQIAIGDGRQLMIDFVDVVHHKATHKEEHHDEQCGEYHNLHGGSDADRHIS